MEFTNHIKTVIAILLNKNEVPIELLMCCNVKVNVPPSKSTSSCLSSSKENVLVIKTDLFISDIEMFRVDKKF